MTDGTTPRTERPTGVILAPGHTFTSVTDKIASIAIARRTPWFWWIGAAVGFGLTLMLLMTITRLVLVGVGVFGVNVPVGWGFDILTSSGGSASATPAR